MIELGQLFSPCFRSFWQVRRIFSSKQARKGGRETRVSGFGCCATRTTALVVGSTGKRWRMVSSKQGSHVIGCLCCATQSLQPPFVAAVSARKFPQQPCGSLWDALWSARSLVGSASWFHWPHLRRTFLRDAFARLLRDQCRLLLFSVASTSISNTKT